jgi:hypothetical protein
MFASNKITMKNIYIAFASIISLALLSGCGDGAKSSKHPKLNIADVMAEFKACKDTASTKHTCKTFVAKAINGNFEISDFNNLEKEGEYIEYDKIIEVVKSSDKWKKIGEATEQGALDYFQKSANENKAVLAISTVSGQSNIAIGVPGEQVKSTSWGVSCPTVAIFFPNRPNKSFIGKTMNYAWGKPDGIALYFRK